MEKSILITGGCGFVGRHLVKRLLQDYDSIWIIDNLFSGKHPDLWLDGFIISRKEEFVTYYKKDNKEVMFVQQDVINFFMSQIKEESSINLPSKLDIFHLASIVGGRQLIDGDPILVATDFAIDSLFFVWATRFKNKISRILYASSSAAYPTSLQTKEKHLALKEEFIKFDGNLGQPDMTYGWSKLSGEYLSTIAAKYYGLSVACVRPFSGYGEDQDISYPIPAIASRIAKREDPITVWGTGEQGRDFVYIDDCIEAMLLTLENISDGSGINIGTGKVTSFNEVISIFIDIEGYSPQIMPLLNKPVGVQSRYSDPTKIFALGWKPKVTFREGLSKVLEERKKFNF